MGDYAVTITIENFSSFTLNCSSVLNLNQGLWTTNLAPENVPPKGKAVGVAKGRIIEGSPGIKIEAGGVAGSSFCNFKFGQAQPGSFSVAPQLPPLFISGPEPKAADPNYTITVTQTE